LIVRSGHWALSTVSRQKEGEIMQDRLEETLTYDVDNCSRLLSNLDLQTNLIDHINLLTGRLGMVINDQNWRTSYIHSYYYYYYYYFNANERRFIARRKATPSSDHSRVRKSYRAGGVKIVTNWRCQHYTYSPHCQKLLRLLALNFGLGVVGIMLNNNILPEISGRVVLWERIWEEQSHECRS
jgi:hypothetical protein